MLEQDVGCEEPAFRLLEDVPDDLQCGICTDLARDPHVTEACGHLFCRTCAQRSLVSSPDCPLCRHGGFSRLRKDHRAARQADSLRVRCGYDGCGWEGALSDLRRHECSQKPVACRFAEFGCGVQVPAAELTGHMAAAMSEHLELAVCAASKAAERAEAANAIVKALQLDVLNLRNALRDSDEAAAATARSCAATLDSLRADVLQLRACHHGTSPSFPAVPSWPEAPPPTFSVVEGRATVVKSLPGWGTVAAAGCPLGGGKERTTWRVRMGCEAGEGFISSTVMVGVTSDTYTSGTHLGNMGHAWCFQDNGFKWDGAQCFAYGQACESGDVIGVDLDLEAGTLSFSRNGVDMGVAFEGVSGFLFPAASLCTKGHSVTFLPD